MQVQTHIIAIQKREKSMNKLQCIIIAFHVFFLFCFNRIVEQCTKDSQRERRRVYMLVVPIRRKKGGERSVFPQFKLSWTHSV